MKHNYVILMAITFLLGLTLFACKKHEEETLTPKITNDKVETTATTATFTWTVDWPGKLISVVEVSENEDMSHSQAYGSETETENHNFSVTVMDLKAHTKYYYRYLVWNRYYVDNKFEMEKKSCLTKGVPSVITGEVSNIGSRTAFCGGNVTSDGGSEISERGICWSTIHNPTLSDPHISNGTGIGGYTVQLTDLALSTKYYVRSYAIYNEGVVYGNEVSFTTNSPSSPIVTTSQATSVKYNMATVGGIVTDDGGSIVTECGIYWGTTNPPTIKKAISNGTGDFSVQLTNLSANTKYYYKAYAVNDLGENTGEVKNFTTLHDPSIPIGAIGGVFSVSSSNKVFFSQGNLQYQASTNTWRFATKQYDYIGYSNTSISSSNSGWIDLFGWGTSGWNSGNTYYHPWDSDDSDGSLYGPIGSNNLTGSNANADWGVYNAISNGGNTTNIWRTLTKEEWAYVFNTRNTSSGIRYAMAQITGTYSTVCGVILLPDNWNQNTYSLNDTNNSTSAYNSNVIDLSQWGVLENAGAVFLPGSSWRRGTSLVVMSSGDGYYWSASSRNNNYAYNINFGGDYLAGFQIDLYDYRERFYGMSVRLVCSAQ